MKSIYVLSVMSLSLVASGCSTIERSRDLADPNVSATALAQQVCSNCHGIAGRVTNPNFPNLAGQQPNYFIAQMKQFRGHNRLDPAGFEYMWGISRSLTDAQIAGLAEYFGTKTSVSPGLATDRAAVARGRAVFEKGVADKNIPACNTCHGATGQGSDQFPRLAHQHVDYLVKQLTVFQRTEERPEGAIMKVIAHDLTSTNIKDVAIYLQEFPLP